MGARGVRFAAAVVLCALGLLACGGDDDGPGGGGGTLSADWPVPLDWEAGQKFGLLIVEHQTKSPAMLMEPQCRLIAQVAEATAAGGLAIDDREGACVVTSADTLAGHESTLTPLCAGTIRTSYGDTTTITVCNPDAFPPPVALDCIAFAAATELRTTSGPGEIEGDVLGTLDIAAPRATVPVVTSPAPTGTGTAVWSDGPLRVEWEPGRGDAIELVLNAQGSTGPRIRCLVPDDGAFTIPERLVAPLRTATASLEVARITQARTGVDGIDFRASWRTSTALWIYVPR